MPINPGILPKTGVIKKLNMAKVQRLLVFQQELSFLNVGDKIQLLYKRFYSTDLGKIYKTLPAESIAKKIKLKQNIKGPQSIYSNG